MNKKTLSIACITAAVAVCACAPKNAQKEAAGAAAPGEQVQAIVPLVEVMAAVKENVPQDAVYSTTVQANVINNIAPQTAGRIKKLNVEIGDFVSAGQIVAEMDDVQLQQTGFKLKNEETELERVRALFEEGGVSQSDLDQLELSHKVNKAAYDNLLENTVLRSPVSGVITARNYDRGDLYAMAQPLYTIQQITPVKILVGVSESDYTRVKKGDKAAITVDALPGREYEGTVVRLYPTMDAATHTFMAEVQVRNSNRELRPGMYARVKINFGARFNITLPDVAAVKQQGSGQRSVFVYNPEDGTVAMRNVELGRHFDGKYEIVSGIEEGEMIVVKGQASLKAGEKVEVR